MVALWRTPHNCPFNADTPQVDKHNKHMLITGLHTQNVTSNHRVEWELPFHRALAQAPLRLW